METSVYNHFEIYLLAILLGALMGLERERKKERVAGLRTFILVVLFGSICGQISQSGGGGWILLAGVITVAVQSAMMNVLRIHKSLETGLTTAVALLVAFAIGILVAFGQKASAVALSLATTVILYFKPQLHDFSQNLTKLDLQAIFQFGLIAFIILPVLPDQAFGPYDALNPTNIWLMVVMISGLNLVGYVTLKLVGQRWGGPFLGILGGLVSSTATTLSMSRHARSAPDFSTTGSVAIALASTVVLVRMAVLTGVIHLPLLKSLVLPLSAMFAGGLIPVLFIWVKSTAKETPVPETKNPTELKQALLFGLVYAVILLSVSAGQEFFGDKGVYTIALISGLTDVDAITLSNSRLAGKGVLDVSQAGISLIIAFVANLVFKLFLVGIIGNAKMLRLTLMCFVCLTLPALIVFV
jgi:uncharacterized membrane protein (DUF4010 family)